MCKKLILVLFIMMTLLAASPGMLFAKEEIKLFLKKPEMGQGFSQKEKEIWGARVQSKLSDKFLSQPGIVLLTDDDIASLMEEAEMRAALDCNTDECFRSILTMIGARYLVRLKIVRLEGLDVSLDAAYSKRDENNILLTMATANVARCNLENSDELNHYLSEIAKKLMQKDYSIRKYSEFVDIQISVQEVEEIKLQGIAKKKKSGSAFKADVEVEETEKLDEVSVKLPDFKIKAASGTEEQMLSGYQSRIKNIDKLIQEYKFKEAIKAYRKIKLDARETVKTAPEYSFLSKLYPLLEERIGRAQNGWLLYLTQKADQEKDYQLRIAAYRKIIEQRDSIQSEYQKYLKISRADLLARLNTSHRYLVQQYLQQGDKDYQNDDYKVALESYKKAASYSKKHADELANSSRLLNLIEERRLACHEAVFYDYLREGDDFYSVKDYGPALKKYDLAGKYQNDWPGYLKKPAYANDLKERQTAAHSGIVSIFIKKGDAALEAKNFPQALAIYKEAQQYAESQNAFLRASGINSTLRGRILYSFQIELSYLIKKAEALYQNAEFFKAEKAFVKVVDRAKDCQYYDELSKKTKRSRSREENAYYALVETANLGKTKSYKTALSIFRNRMKVYKDKAFILFSQDRLTEAKTLAQEMLDFINRHAVFSEDAQGLAETQKVAKILKLDNQIENFRKLSSTLKSFDKLYHSTDYTAFSAGQINKDLLLIKSRQELAEQTGADFFSQRLVEWEIKLKSLSAEKKLHQERSKLAALRESKKVRYVGGTVFLVSALGLAGGSALNAVFWKINYDHYMNSGFSDSTVTYRDRFKLNMGLTLALGSGAVLSEIISLAVFPGKKNERGLEKSISSLEKELENYQNKTK